MDRVMGGWGIRCAKEDGLEHGVTFCGGVHHPTNCFPKLRTGFVPIAVLDGAGKECHPDLLRLVNTGLVSAMVSVMFHCC